MGFLDRAKEAASRAKSQARVARVQGQQRLEDLQARRQAEVLLREVGIVAYEEHRGESDHEAVVRALARLDAHLRNHPLDLSTGGLRGYVRTAAGPGGDAETPADAPGTEPTWPATDAAEPPDEPAPAAADPAPPAEEPPAGPAAQKTAKKTAKKSAAKKATKKAPAKKTAAKKTAKKPPTAEPRPEPPIP